MAAEGTYFRMWGGGKGTIGAPHRKAPLQNLQVPWAKFVAYVNDCTINPSFHDSLQKHEAPFVGNLGGQLKLLPLPNLFAAPVWCKYKE